jgi:hypothetical protein
MLLPRRVAAFREGPKDSQGGTGKAEDAKLPGAGIIPKPCPRKGEAEMQASKHIQRRGLGTVCLIAEG